MSNKHPCFTYTAATQNKQKAFSLKYFNTHNNKIKETKKERALE